MSDYVLGVNEKELERLRLQQEIWGEATRRFLARAGIRKGWRGLDVGCGPGFVVEDILKHVGSEGAVVALDASPVWLGVLKQRIEKQGWRNVETMESKIESAFIPPASLDFIFARWVLSFPPEPQAIIRKFAEWLKPGGLLAVQDYNHEGISLFPESRGFRAAVEATRRLYRSGGGDPWIAGKLLRYFREAGLVPGDYQRHGLCGPPESPAFRWADSFFPEHSHSMVEKGFLSKEDQALFLREWEERKKDPNAVFFSPIVVDALAAKPGT